MRRRVNLKKRSTDSHAFLCTAESGEVYRPNHYYMKNFIYALGLACFCCLFASCEPKLELSKCEEMILSYPLFKETHVAVTDQVLPDCEEALAGCVKGAYIK